MFPMQTRVISLGTLALGGLLHHLPASEVAFPGADWERVAPATEGMDAALLDQAAQVFGEACGKDGSGEIIIVRNGRIVWQGDRIDAVHPIWSCTKTFTSTCLGLLWDDGLCTPDTKVITVVPEIGEAYADITLRHLATFTAGFDAEKGVLNVKPPLHPPGAAIHYGIQTHLLALALTRIAKEDLRTLWMRRIGTPIGIAEADLDWGLQDLPDEPIPVRGGTGGPPAVVSIPAHAFARFIWLFAQNGVWNGQRLLSARYLTELATIQVAADVPPHDAKAWYTVLPGRYGLNCWVNGPNAAGEMLWNHLPPGCFAAQGNRNNIGIAVPTWNLAIIRLGTDPARPVEGYDAAFGLLKASMIKGGSLGTAP